MLDACDQATFDAAVGPGTCTRKNGLSFNQFVALLTANQTVGAWRFAPAQQVQARLGQTIEAVNLGGEFHSFTKVAEFGGGIIPFLNTLSGTPVPAPECLVTSDFVPPGGKDSEVLDHTGTSKFMC
jgi:hypothetical protein